MCRDAREPIDAVRAHAAAVPDERPLRERVPTFDGKAVKRELELRGLSSDGRLADLRARLLAWLDVEDCGVQRLRSLFEREDALQDMTAADMRAEISRRGVLLPVGTVLSYLDNKALRRLLAHLTSTPREFVVDSLSLGWREPPVGYVLAPLPALPVSAGPREILECRALAILLRMLRIPDELRPRYGGHSDLIDLMVRDFFVCLFVCLVQCQQASCDYCLSFYFHTGR